MRAVSLKRQKQDRLYKPIHDAVIERDLWSCQAFGWTEVSCRLPLVVHHVISRARDKTLALEPSNLVTLCWDHHVAVHANVALATERGLLSSAPLEEHPK